MALIKCPECGKEISDMATACVNCGYPIATMKKETVKPAGTAAMPSGKGTQSLFDDMFTNSSAKTAPAKPVPKEKPEMKFFPGVAVQLLGKISGVAGLAGISALGLALIELLKGNSIEAEGFWIMIAALAGSFASSYLKIWIDFLDAKKFIRKNGYEASIRNDTPTFSNSMNAFGLCPGREMARYIKKLNPIAGNALENAMDRKREKDRKERLGRLPYLAILLVAYCLLPRLDDWTALPYGGGMIIAHIVALVVMLLYGYKQRMTVWTLVLIGAMSALPVYAYYYEWYHIVICVVVTVVGVLIGMKVRSKR